MKKTNHLHELIHSMTKNEKRYFKISASKHVIGSKNNYVLLFDFVVKQTEPNDDEIRDKFKGENFIKRLSAAKYDLYNLILRSLNEYHTMDTIKGQIRDQLQRASVLQNKALYAQAQKVLVTAKKQAYQFDEFKLLLDIIEQELSVIQRLGQMVERKEEVDELQTESEGILKKMLNISQFDRIGSNTTKRMNSIGRPRNTEELAAYSEIVASSKLWNSEEEKFTPLERMHLFKAKSLWYYAVNDVEKSWEYTKKRVDLYEQYIERITDPSNYLSALYNLEVTSNKLEKYELGREVREKILNFDKINDEWKITENNRVLMYKSLNNELIYLIQTAQYEKADVLVENIASQLDDFKGKLGESDEVIYLYNFTNLYIYSEKYNKALKWLSRLLNHKYVGYREDVYSFARILNLLVHYELGNFDVLPYYVRSTYRYLKKEDRTTKIEYLLVDFIKKKVPKFERGANQSVMDAFKDLKHEIDEVLASNEYEATLMEYFDLSTYLSSKINRSSFRDEYLKKHPERRVEE